MSQLPFAELFPEQYAALNSHPLSTLRREVSKSNIKLSVNHKRLTKNDLITVMLAHRERFLHIKELPPKPVSPARLARVARGPKRTAEELKAFRIEQGKRLSEMNRERLRQRPALPA